MTLREFVADTLRQITGGVGDARRENTQIAPPVALRGESSAYVVYPGGVANPGAFLVDFDVAVTISQKADVDAGGGVSVHILQMGAKSKASDEHSTVSRIKFQVPVTFDKVH